MYRTAIVSFLAAGAFACGSQPTAVTQNTNTAAAPQRAEKLQTTIAHTNENEPPKMPETSGLSNGNSKWSQGGEPIDTAKFDGTIETAEKTVKAKPADTEAKKMLAEAYFDRGFALTGARQYASALGDYRRALKNDPANEDAQKWIDQIVSIYGMMKKDYPKEGEEPPPLPFKKDKAAL